MLNYQGICKDAKNLPGQVEFNRRKNVEQDQRLSTIGAQVQTLINQRPSGFLPKVYYGLTRGPEKYRFNNDVEFTIQGLDGEPGDAYELQSLNDSNYIPAIVIQSDIDKIKISVQGDYNINTNTFNLINMVTGSILNITLSSPLTLQEASFLGSYNAQDNQGKQITVLHNLETNEENVVFGSVDFNNDGTYNWIRLGGYTNGTDGRAIWTINSTNVSSILSLIKINDSIISSEDLVEGNISFTTGDLFEVTGLNPLSGTLLGNLRGPQGLPGSQGIQGPDGENGKTPEIINGNWWIGEEDTGVVAVGQNGANGQNGQSFQMKSGLYSLPNNYGEPNNEGPNGETLLQLPTLPTTGITGFAYVIYDPLTTPLSPFYDLFYANDGDSEWTIIHPFSGLKGTDGTNGYTPYIQNNVWYINGVSTGVSAQGPQGLQGEKGINPMGLWVSNNEYYVDDVVTYNGSSYICIQDHQDISMTPNLDTTNWLIFVEKGATGSTGQPAGFGTPTAQIDSNTGTPSVTITSSGPNTAKIFNFSFKNLKGPQGLQGIQGPTGPTGPGVPTGGTSGQYLKKDSSTNYDTSFETPDTTPTNGSSKLITSGGVYTANNSKANLTASNLSTSNITSWQDKLGTSKLIKDYTSTANTSNLNITGLDLIGDGGIYQIYAELDVANGTDANFRVNNISSAVYDTIVMNGYSGSSSGLTMGGGPGSGNFPAGVIQPKGAYVIIDLIQSSSTEVFYKFMNFSADNSNSYMRIGGGKATVSGSVTSIQFITAQNILAGARVRIYSKAQ